MKIGSKVKIIDEQIGCEWLIGKEGFIKEYDSRLGHYIVLVKGYYSMRFLPYKLKEIEQ